MTALRPKSSCPNRQSDETARLVPKQQSVSLRRNVNRSDNDRQLNVNWFQLARPPEDQLDWTLVLLPAKISNRYKLQGD